MKRRLAIAFLGGILLLVAGSLALLRTAWAGRELCALASARVQAATGERLELEACRVEPLSLSVEARGIRLGPPGAPLFQAERLRARLAPIQALGGALELAELELVRPRVTATLPPRDPRAPAPRCPPDVLQRVAVRRLQVVEASLDLTLPGGERLRAARLDIQGTPGTRARGLRALASGARRTSLLLELEGLEAGLGSRALRVDAARAELDVASDLSSVEVVDAWAHGSGARVELRGSVETPCQPVLDLRVQAQAPLAALLEAAGKKGLAPAGSAR